MNTTHSHSSDAGDRDDSGDDMERDSTPRWWIAIWSSWGLIVGVVVLWLDRDPIAAALWLLGGIAIGTCAVRIFGRFASPAFRWYDQFASDPEQRDRMLELVIADQTDTAEFERLLENETNRSVVFIPPMFGLFYGVLLGGICGALCELDATLKVTASEGAIYGVFLGTILISFTAAVLMAVIVPQDKTRPLKYRIVRRAQMMVSPLFVLPVAWHCLKWMFQRRPENAI